MTKERMTGLALCVLLALGTPVGTEAQAPAQSGQVQVSYDVEFYTTGQDIAQLGSPCPDARGTDKLSGTITGWEPAPAGEDITYKGRLIRDTNVRFWYTAPDPRIPDQHINCSVTIPGKALVLVEFDLYADGRGGYFRAMGTSVQVLSSRVTGTCDPSEMAQWQADYGTMSTAGSPDGQPIEVPALPRAPFPKTFPPNPPQSVWTLTVLGRRP